MPGVLQAYEFFLFAGLMVAVMLLFIWLAIRYKYVDYASEEDEEEADQRPLDLIASSKPESNGNGDTNHKS